MGKKIMNNSNSTTESNNGNILRRRGSGINNILTSFGIRQNHTNVGSHSQQEELHNPPRHSQPMNIIQRPQINDISQSMLGATPFDTIAEQPQNDNGAIDNNLDVQLPITLILGSNLDNPLATVQNDPQAISINPQSDNQSLSKSTRHFIYPANFSESEHKIKIDLPLNSRSPDVIGEGEIKKRKDKNGLFTIRLTPFIDQSSLSNLGLFFEPIIRTAGPNSQLVIGRYTERVREAIGKIPESFHPVVFKSKVVSRTHGVFKVDIYGNWYVKDVKSSSGTFLNHQRLSQASSLSKDFLLKDGDILQLGMDFRGGTEEIYRCVKMRVELNRSWKRRANIFNKEAMAKLKNLQKMTADSEEEDCSICLSKIKPCQAIFISPCSHNWHYRCIRRLVMSSYPQFVCPNCRSACDLEASLDTDDENSDDDNYEIFIKSQSHLRNPLDLDIPISEIIHEGSDDVQVSG